MNKASLVAMQASGVGVLCTSCLIEGEVHLKYGSLQLFEDLEVIIA